MFKEVHVDDIEMRAGAPQIVSLLTRYRALCVNGSLPSFADFNPESIPEHASNLAVVEPTDDGDYLYVYYGRAIFEASGVEMLGSKVSQWTSEVGLFFCQAYDRAVAERRPLYTVHRANHAIRVHLWERLVLPVSAQDGSLRLVVFNRAREYLDDVFRAVLDASPDGIMGLRCIRGSDGRIEDAMVMTANHRAATIVGCSLEKLLDHPILEVVPELKGTKTWSRYLDVVETRRPQQFELSFGRGDDIRWFDVKAVPVGDGFMVSVSEITTLRNAYRELEARNGDLARANALLERHTTRLSEEVSRREALEGELRRLADFDTLTGAATRRAFMCVALRAISRASPRQPLAVIAVDIDQFKSINDQHGHSAGDKVLMAVGEELRRDCRGSDIVGRLGGEEFAILLGHTNLDGAIAIAERIRQKLASTSVSIGDAHISVTASFGVAAFSEGDTFDTLLARADEGLYLAKRAGRDRVIVVDDRPLAQRRISVA